MASKRSIMRGWRQLYDAAGRLKDLAPWEWMSESDVFGIEHPETGALGFASVMGVLGEHCAVTVYLGPEALDQFWQLQQAGPSVTYMAQSLRRFEDHRLLTGQSQFVDDMTLPGMLHAVILRSPHAHATIAAIVMGGQGSSLLHVGGFGCGACIVQYW